MNSKSIAALSLALLLGGVGCQASHVDKHWGEAYRTAVARQTAQPELASINADEETPQGLNGATTDDVMGKYHKNQQPNSGQKPSALAEIFGVGGK